MSLLKKYISRKVNCRRQRYPVWWDYRLSYQVLSIFKFIIIWSDFRGGSSAPLVSQFLNMVLNWNLLFDKWWRLVTWLRHWCVFRRLEAISHNVCKIEKWRHCTLTAFQSESVMHRLKCQNGRGFDTEMFLMNFWSGGGKVPLQQKKLCSIKIN